MLKDTKTLSDKQKKKRLYSKTFPRNTASFLYFLRLPYTVSYSICSSRSSDNGDRSSISHFIRTAIFILFGHYLVTLKSQFYSKI